MKGGATLHMLNTSLVRNTASSEGGGALYNVLHSEHDGLIYIADSNIQNNSASLEGGGIFAESEVLLMRTNVCGNFAQQGGGVFALSDFALWDSRCGVNSAKEAGGCATTWTSTTIVNSYIGDNSARDRGGGVHHHGGKMLLQRCEVHRNSAELGGGFYIGEDSEVILEANCSVHKNTATASGGAMVISPYSTVSIHGGTQLIANYAEKEGGGVYFRRGSGQLLVQGGSKIEGNKAIMYFGGAVSTNMDNTVILEDVDVSENSARLYGGAMYLIHTVVHATNVRFIQNRADEGGAIYGTLGSMLWFTGNASHPTVMRENMAQLFGGAVKLSDSKMQFGNDLARTDDAAEADAQLDDVACLGDLNNLDLRTYDAILERNFAGVVGGAIYATATTISLWRARVTLSGRQGSSIDNEGYAAAITTEKSNIEVRASAIENSWGTGLILRNSSVAEITASLFLHNRHSNVGGALKHVSDSHTSIRCSVFINNSATVRGGAMRVEGGQLHMDHCHFIGNEAPQGGVVDAEMGTDSALNFSDSYFAENMAVDGAVLYLTPTTSGDGVTFLSLENLTFTQNSAAGGGVIFWDPVDIYHNHSEPPPCHRCSPVDVLSDNTALYSSYEGWASPAKYIMGDDWHPKVTGSTFIEQPIDVWLTDMFGSVVASENATRIQVMTIGDACKVDDTSLTTKTVTTGRTSFARLMLYGDPGSQCLLLFQEDSGKTHSFSLEIPLRLCTMGETLVSQKCEACEPGSISFDNSTSTCISCWEEQEDVVRNGIECTGGNGYHVLPGYWVSPNAQFCGRDAQCFMYKIYECDTSEACQSSEEADRYGAGAEDAERMQALLCDTVQFSYGVQCGGTDPPICSYDHYTSATPECYQCPSAAVSFLTLIIVLVLLVAVVAAVCYLLFPTKDPDETADAMEEGQTTSTAIMQAKESMKLLVSYLQIVSQIGNIFSDTHVPTLFSEMSGYLSFVNFNLELMLNLKCLAYHTGHHQSSGTFYFRFWQSVATPWACIAVFGTGFLIFRQRNLHRYQKVVKARKVSKVPAEKAGLVDALVDPKSWLKVDSSVECFTEYWYFALIFDVFTMLCYVFGYPLILFSALKNLRSYHKVRMRREDALKHIPLMTKRKWKLVDPEERMLLRTGCLGPTPPASPSDAPTCDKAPGSSSYESEWMDIFVATHTFEEVEETEDDDGNSKGMRRARSTNGDAIPRDLIQSVVYDNDLRSTHISVQGGKPMAALMHQKDDFGDGGQITKKPRTYLDEAANSMVFSQFVNAFEDGYFYWQTGIVVSVVLVCGELAGSVFAVLASVSAIVLHLAVSPYISDSSDELQLYLLISTFTVYLTSLVMQADSGVDSLLGYVLIGIQLVIMTYVLFGIIPELYEAYMILYNSAQKTRKWANSSSLFGSFNRRDSELVIDVASSDHGSSRVSRSELDDPDHVWTTNLLAAAPSPRSRWSEDPQKAPEVNGWEEEDLQKSVPVADSCGEAEEELLASEEAGGSEHTMSSAPADSTKMKSLQVAADLKNEDVSGPTQIAEMCPGDPPVIVTERNAPGASSTFTDDILAQVRKWTEWEWG
eukprot:gene3672-4607_t